MSSSNTRSVHSTAAIDGSADESLIRFAPSPSRESSKPPSQLAAEKAMAQDRATRFMADTSPLGAIIVDVHGHGNNTTDAKSCQEVAAIRIAAFDAVFEEKKKVGEGSESGTRNRSQ
ncbi:hypothetical protein DL98DRAFT_608810 [Cadophora sp. DSE1049]|nr:hypothetical protein DL98DRAFT_608810 [Cadophora sp. DSE1049]